MAFTRAMCGPGCHFRKGHNFLRNAILGSLAVLALISTSAGGQSVDQPSVVGSDLAAGPGWDSSSLLSLAEEGVIQLDGGFPVDSVDEVIRISKSESANAGDEILLAAAKAPVAKAPVAKAPVAKAPVAEPKDLKQKAVPSITTDQRAVAASKPGPGTSLEDKERAAKQAATRESVKQSAMQPVENAGQYPLKLKNLFVSHGNLFPPFTPTTFDYTLKLPHRTDQLAVTPEIFKDSTAYRGGEQNRPLVEIDWSNSPGDRVVPEVASVAVRKQIDLPDDLDNIQITIRVVNPHDSSDSQSYVMHVTQPNEPLTVVKGIEAFDSRGNVAIIDPIPAQGISSYKVYVQPDADAVTLKVDCLGSHLTIAGQAAKKNVPFTLQRDLTRHVQLVDITCGTSAGKLFGGHYDQSATVFLQIAADFMPEDIPPPLMVVQNLGRECRANKAGGISCPDPRLKTKKASVVSRLNPQIRYVIRSPDSSVQVRLLDQYPSAPITYASRLHLEATSGRFTKVWDLDFSVPIGNIWAAALGWLLSSLLGCLLTSLVVVLGLTSLLGIGLPCGLTEVASVLTMLLQFLCFVDNIRGEGLLSAMTAPLKWCTLFWPLPWDIHGRESLHTIGNLKHINNAAGCLFWSAIIVGVLVLCHGAAIAKFFFVDYHSTVPHRLTFGGLESRCLHWLIFPLSVASSLLLMSHEVNSRWKCCAVAALGMIVYWCLASWVLVKKSISDGRVLWVWNSTGKDSALLPGDEANSGYWSDALCDQISTEPADRSFFPFFQWKWVSTVADIDPVLLRSEVYNRSSQSHGNGSRDSSASAALRGDSSEPVPMAKNPKAVEVLRARAPGGVCPGQRLMVGLLPLHWLDVVMSYRALTLLHSRMVRGGTDFLVPLVVKTNQLQGPVTCGKLEFFFEGVRLPFAKIADSILRLVLGLSLGVALASEAYAVDAGVFGFTALLSSTALIYFAVTIPLTRRLENLLTCAAMAAIALCSWGYMGYALSNKSPSTVSDLFIIITTLVALCVAGHSLVVTTSLFAAVLCPPLVESRFIERLSNCSVVIADHDERWIVDMPAYCKFSVDDLKVQCTAAPFGSASKGGEVSIYSSSEESLFEFSPIEIHDACRFGNLQPPIMTLTVSDTTAPLGYSHVNIYESNGVAKAVRRFVAETPTTRDMAQVLTKRITRQCNVSARGPKAVVVMTIIPPSDLNSIDPRVREFEYSSLATSENPHREGDDGSSYMLSSTTTASISRSDSEGHSHRHSRPTTSSSSSSQARSNPRQPHRSTRSGRS